MKKNQFITVLAGTFLLINSCTTENYQEEEIENVLINNVEENTQNKLLPKPKWGGEEIDCCYEPIIVVYYTDLSLGPKLDQLIGVYKSQFVEAKSNFPSVEPIKCPTRTFTNDLFPIKSGDLIGYDGLQKEIYAEQNGFTESSAQKTEPFYCFGAPAYQGDRFEVVRLAH